MNTLLINEDRNLVHSKIIEYSISIARADEIWMMVDKQHVESIYGFLSAIYLETVGIYNKKIFILSDDPPEKVYVNCFYITNKELNKDNKYYNSFCYWNIDENDDIQYAISIGYTKFYSSVIASDTVLNINSPNRLLAFTRMVNGCRACLLGQKEKIRGYFL